MPSPDGREYPFLVSSLDCARDDETKKDRKSQRETA